MRKLWFALWMLVGCGLDTHAAANLLQNGVMAASQDSAQPIADWKGYQWDGRGTLISHESSAGRRAALIRNDGPAKQAIFQGVALAACSYRLDLEFAASELAPNADKRAAAVHVAFDGGRTALTFDLVKEGSLNWHRARVQFSSPRATQAIVYLFNYGAGAFFVRFADLTAEPGCSPSQDRLSALQPTGDKLVYEAPIGPEGQLLAGYCARAAFKMRAVCQHLAAAGPAVARAAPSAPKMIDDFEGRSIFSGHSDERTSVIEGTASARLVSGKYMSAAPEQGLPTDWLAYDWLRIDVLNASPLPQRLYVEISDDKTTGYWSRVNWTTTVPEGRSVVSVPVKTFVGEAVVIGERRRLDASRIRRLVLTATAADLVVDNIRLEVEPPFSNDFAELIKLDFGPPTSAVFPGFVGFHPGLTYRDKTGIGLAPGTRIGKVEDRRHPGTLLGDWISFLSGGIDIDLPDDTYHVWMMLEDAGYWGYYPSFVRRTIMAQGQPLLEEVRSLDEFWRRFYANADGADQPGDDTFARYVQSRYRPLERTVAVRGGRLSLRFDGFGDPHALPVSALVIYPASEAQRGKAFTTELWGRLKREFDRVHVQVQQRERAEDGPKESAPTRQAGSLRLLTRTASEAVSAELAIEASTPVQRQSLTLAPGFAQPIALGIASDKDAQLSDVRLTIPGVTARVSSIRRKMARVTADGTVYASVPRVLDPLFLAPGSKLPLTAGQTQWLWVDLAVDEGAKPGLRKGTLSIMVADGRRAEVEIEVTVAGWVLPDADIPFGYLGSAPMYPETAYPAVGAKRFREFEVAGNLLRSIGMTVASGGLGGPQLKGYADGRPLMAFRDVDKTMEVLGRSFEAPVLAYLGLEIAGLSIKSPEDTQSRFGRPYADVVRDVLQSLANAGRLHSWRPITHVLADEPGEDAVSDIETVGRAFRRADPNVRTAVFTSLQTPGSDKRHRLAGAVSDIYLNAHSAAGITHVRRAGSTCALYNQTGRYRRGVYLFKLRELGCAGHMQFAFHSAHADQWYDLDGRESDLVAVFTHPDGVLRWSADAMIYREAVTDYRHLMLLQKMIGAAPGSATAREARGWLDRVVAEMGVGSDARVPWNDRQLADLRRQAAVYIGDLAR